MLFLHREFLTQYIYDFTRTRPVIFPHSTMTFSTDQIDPESKDTSCGPDKDVWYVFYKMI